MKKNLLCAFIAPLLVLGVNENKQVEKNEELHSKIIYDGSLNKTMNNQEEDNEERGKVNLNVHLDYDNFSFREMLATESVEEYKNNKLMAAKEYYKRKNEEFITSNQQLVDESMYISSYGPFITYDYDNLDECTYLLSKLEAKEEIDEIVVKEIKENKNFLERAKGIVKVRDYISNTVLTGKGVTVGILESGIVDKNHENFKNTDLTVRDEWYYKETVTEHSTIMASIIAGQYGIAKEAKLLSVELSGGPESEIDWLLDRGVDIINLSYGDATPNGSYSAKSAYMDYIANQYGITFVAAAGNENENVVNPGLGYNVLTVGSCDISQAPQVSSFSGYKVVNGPLKPNLVAPGESVNVKPFGLQDGTSVSTAITTGCIALLMENEPSLKLHPERVIALLSANATSLSSDSFGKIDDKSGVGLLNFDNAYKNKYKAFYRYNTSQSHITSKLSINVNENDKIRIAMAWLANANGKANGTSLTDYDLRLYNENDLLVKSSATSRNNVEFIEVIAKSTGTYKIELFQYGDKVKDDNVAVYYKIN